MNWSSTGFRRWIELNAFSYPMKHVYKLSFHSRDFSMMFCSLNVCSVVPLPGLNPASSLLSLASTWSLNLVIMIFAIILAGIHNSVIPLQSPAHGTFGTSPFLVELHYDSFLPVIWYIFIIPDAQKNLLKAVICHFKVDLQYFCCDCINSCGFSTSYSFMI